ncbi:hypothetical protein G5T42_02260 [Microbacterium sp. 4R-513]|uniref:hypothetical protein n=1 Tax=Microbacterium sp. 4R-513 TaxID=2567934 RepID=UPI0013E1A25D|nr:hypothetical protein [Microbacterium sp. 4R-513]QIG38446.1 hypothetical protein G5T42_02260 [Microbacterium sp. 4R-513]
MGASTEGGRRELSALLRVLAFIGAALVAVAFVAVVVSALSSRGVSLGDTTLLCQSANRLLAGDEDRAEEVVAILTDAGVGDPKSAPWPELCDTVLQKARWLSADLKPDLAEQCEKARAQLAEGSVDDARDTLDEAGVSAENADDLPAGCALVWRLSADAADDAGTDGDAGAGQGTTAQGAGPLDVACDLAERQLFKGEYAAAVATLRAAGASEASQPENCPGVWAVAASLADAAKAGVADDTGAEQVGGWWDDFVEHYLTPLASGGLFLLGGWLALIVLARLLVELPIARDLTSSTASRRAAAVIGWVTLLVVPLALGILGVVTAAGARSGVGIAIALGAVAAIGVLGAAALAAWIATLRKLDVSVDDTGKTGPGLEQIVARLRGLATDTGRSIELQSAPMLRDISKDLGDLSKDRWIVAVQNVVLFLVGIKPWRATVKVGGANEASVIVGRNGRTVDARQIRLDAPALRALTPLPSGVTPADILAVFIAAEILMALRPAYPRDFEAGLDGATKADAVALQFICEQWYMRQPSSEQAVALLRRAVEVDPGHRLSIATLQSARFRQSDDIEELLSYASWLQGQST